jgi:hypothetical protein
VRFLAGAGYSAGGVGWTDHLGASLVWRPTRRLGVALDLAMTPLASRVSGPEGEATLGLYLAGISFGHSLLDPSAAVRLRSGAGVWLGVMTMSGDAGAGYVSQHATVIAALPHADLALEVPLSPRLAFGAQGSLGTSTPGVAIQFAGRRTATWGRPFGLGVLFLEASLD